MSRKTRMYLPGMPALITHQGNNGEPCFFSDKDYQFYLESLGHALSRYQVSLHAYVLLPNQVYFLMTPDTSDGISRVMSLLGKQYVAYINRTYHRRGTLWEGRHKASILDARGYLLICYQYIESVPVIAGVVKRPEEYQWSSYLHHGLQKPDPLINDHDYYLALAKTTEARSQDYRLFFSTGIDKTELQKVQLVLQHNFPLGDDQFNKDIEGRLQRKIGFPRRGRPRQVRRPVTVL
jgi:putative transposase